MIRQPAVAGQFYPGNEAKLEAELTSLVTPVTGTRRVVGVIVPHAGYLYSGAVAGDLYGRIAIPSAIIILGPNHHGIGASTALYPDGEWLTPLGAVAINPRLAILVKNHSPQVEIDTVAHQFEHSLEVQVPFLQHIRPDITIVPLCLGFGDFAHCRSLGEGIARAIKEYGEEVLIIASSDMTHYEAVADARLKDEQAIRKVLALDPEGLVQVCRAKGITMCGVIPAAVMLVAARELGASKAELLRYASSGDVTGDNSQVVTYAAMTVY